MCRASQARCKRTNSRIDSPTRESLATLNPYPCWFPSHLRRGSVAGSWAVFDRFLIRPSKQKQGGLNGPLFYLLIGQSNKVAPSFDQSQNCPTVFQRGTVRENSVNLTVLRFFGELRCPLLPSGNNLFEVILLEESRNGTG